MNKQLQTLFKEFEGIIGEDELLPVGIMDEWVQDDKDRFWDDYSQKSGRNNLRAEQRQQLQKLKSKYLRKGQ